MKQAIRNFSLLIILGILFSTDSNAQELFVLTEPASNMPTNSISGKLTGKYLKGIHSGRLEQRYTPEIMFGLSKKWMIHVSGTFSDMYSPGMKWESVRGYGKYRFLSMDEVHRHFRMAAFGAVSHSSNSVYYDELTLEGDQGGVQGGIIVTQLWNKLAVSSTISYLQVIMKRPKLNPDAYSYQALDYSLSGGYLLFPVSYTDYRQLNLNLYTELLCQQSLDHKKYFVDLAPAVQLIFNSNAKLNIGYRFQLKGNMHRMAEKSWLVGLERSFLNAMNRKGKSKLH